MPTTTNPAMGRPRAILTDADLATWNQRFATVIFHEQGVAIVVDELTGDRYRFHAFKQKFGASAERWLAHPERRTYEGEAAFRSAIRTSSRRQIGRAATAIAPSAERRRR